MNYLETVQKIEKLSIMPEGPPSLEKMHQAIARIQPQVQLNPKQTILVAGTNGKGSVCATLEALLLSAGQRVGLYTSPHLEETTERFRIQGQDISQQAFCEAYQKTAALTEDLSLTHFEILTAMAVWIFYAHSPVDWGIFEIGLGGLWDATNAIPHQTSVITTLGMDHQNLLGNTLVEIAANKFGIVQTGNRVIHSQLDPSVVPLAHEVQKKTQSHWVASAPFDLSIIPGPQFLIHTKWGQAQLNLPGQRGAENTSLALTVFEELGFQPQNHLSALQKVRWPGRMERIQTQRTQASVYLSGDHNPQGIQSLLSLLKYYPRKNLHIVCGIGKDKEAAPMLSALFDLENTSIYLTETPFRGRSVASYGDFLTQAQAYSSKPSEMLDQALNNAKKGDMLLVTGSLYLVGELRKTLIF